MNTRKDPIGRLAREFATAGHALGDELAGELGHLDPELAAKVAQAVGAGERMLLCLVFDPVAPEIVWMTVDGDDQQKRIMTIPGTVPARH